MARTVSVTLDADVASYLAKMKAASVASADLGKRLGVSAAQARVGLRGIAKEAEALAATQAKAAAAAQAAQAKQNASLGTISRGAATVGLALGVGVGLAVKAAADFDQAMSHVAATGADAKANIDALRQAAIDAGAATSFSAGEAANAQEELAKAGVSARDSLAGGLKGSLDLAAAGTLDVADAANIAATAMTQFKLKGSDVPHVADLLAAGAGKAQGSVQDLGEALNYVGPVAQGMGVSIEETVGTLAEFAQAGIVGEKGGTALRGVLLSLTGPSAAASEAMKKYGIELYDSQGKFVGVNGAAQELQDGLGGLDNATRDAALATIFGNAQITAARVLYSGGAEAVDKWTAAVDDTGFASRQAAEKMNNLKGDVEKLGGALQTALIDTGEGAQGGLRGLAQAAADAVDGFNGFPDGAKSTALAITAVAAAGLLTVAGVAKLAVGINEAKNAMEGLRAGSPRVAGALGAVTKTATAAAVALAALQVAGAVERIFKPNFVPSLEEANAAILKLAESSGKTTDLDSKFKFDTGYLIKDNVDSIGSAFQRLNASKGLLGFGDTLDRQIDRITGSTDSLTGNITRQFTALDTSLVNVSSSGRADQAAASFKKIADAAALQGTPLSKVKELFPEYAASVRDAAKANGYIITSDQELVDIMGGKLPPALQAALASTTDYTSAVAAADAALGAAGLAKSAKLSADGISTLSTTLFAEGNAVQSAADAHAAFEGAVDDAAAAIKKNGQTLNDNTAAGRENLAGLSAIATAGKANVQALIAQGASTKEVTGATKEARKAFIDAAEDAGKTGKQARDLADDYGLIPKKVTTRINLLKEAEAKLAVEKLATALADLPPETAAKIRAIYDKKGATAAQRALDKLDATTAKPYVDVQTNAGEVKQVISTIEGKTVYINVVRTGEHPGATGGMITPAGFIHRSQGGPVFGAGTATSDSIDAKLSDGEFVIKAATVKKIGAGNLLRLNQVGHFAGGGLVGGLQGVDLSPVVALVATIVNPLRDIARATTAVARARTKVAAAKEDQADARRDVRHARGTAAKARAQEAYTKAIEKTRDATDKLKDAQSELADQQKAVADSAKSASENLSGQFQSTSTDAGDWLSSLREGAAAVAAFGARIKRLRSGGLTESLIQQIAGMGVANGTEVATQIAAGGTGLIAALNAAAKNLKNQSDLLGLLLATPGSFAAGGPVTGPGTGLSDSIPARLSNGEWVVPAAAASANRGVLEAMTYGRTVVDRNYARGYATGGPVRSSAGPLIDQAALAGAVRAGMQGMTMSATVHGDTVTVMIDRAIGGFVGGFGRGNA